MQEDMRWNAFNGMEVYFWQESWIPGYKALSSYEEVLVPYLEENYMVASYINDKGEWDILRLQPYLLEVFKIMSILPPYSELRQDKPT